MYLQRIRITNVRNLGEIDLRLGSGINLIKGPNASGKSSLLEAIHLLSCGKSFRSHQPATVVSFQAPSFVVSGEVAGEEGDVMALGVSYERDKGRLQMRAAGEALLRASELAARLPLVVTHQESYRVFTEGPRLRREYLDWGLFHVEPGFLSVWRRYCRALKQRNTVLQQRGDGSARVWDRELAQSGEQLDALRQSHLQRLMPVFQDFSSLLRLSGQISADYFRGWREDAGLEAVLQDAASGDARMGYTRFGAHRADIRFTVGDVPVRDCLSRGQLKVAVCALFLAQAFAYTHATGRRCVVLMDDLSAELDDTHIAAILSRLQGLGLQVLITSSEDRLMDCLEPKMRTVFHVEHGKISEVI